MEWFESGSYIYEWKISFSASFKSFRMLWNLSMSFTLFIKIRFSFKKRLCSRFDNSSPIKSFPFDLVVSSCIECIEWKLLQEHQQRLFDFPFVYSCENPFCKRCPFFPLYHQQLSKILDLNSRAWGLASPHPSW
jgi:hypothetical protein